jgi:hypothetical protein
MVIPCLYDMGIGHQLSYANEDGWEKGPMLERGGVVRYPTIIQNMKDWNAAHKMQSQFHKLVSGYGGREIIRIPRTMIQKQYVGRAIVDKNNNPKFGDYIVMMRENTRARSSNPVELRSDYKTVPGIGSIHELVFMNDYDYIAGEKSEFLHITMSQAAMGNKKRSNPENSCPFDNFRPDVMNGMNDAGERKFTWPFNSDESLIPYAKSKSKKIIRPFERMNDVELMSWMVGINTADAEGINIGERLGDSASIIFIPTWKDARGRMTADLTQGMGDYYSDIIRCGECNGRTLVMLPSGNELEAADCPHCTFTGGLNTSHLVEGNPRPVMQSIRANR